jgi:hypothetical protein
MPIESSDFEMVGAEPWHEIGNPGEPVFGTRPKT